MSEQILSNSEMDELAFIILKELGVDKADVELVQSIRVHRKDFYEARKQIQEPLAKAVAIKRPI